MKVMTTKMLALALAAAVLPAGSAALAAGVPAHQGDAKPNAAEIRMSEDGFQAMRDVRLARLEIFDGDTARAQEMVATAAKALNAAEADGLAHFRQVRPHGQAAALPDAALWVPVDGRLFFTDDFVATPEKQQHIAAANGHLGRGDRAKAMEELRLAQVDVGLSRVLMPLGSTRAHVQTAGQLLGQGKFYEANLALKAAEDGLVTDTEVLITRPAAKPQS